MPKPKFVVAILLGCMVLIAFQTTGQPASLNTVNHTRDSSGPLLLWPGTAPGEKGDIGEENDATKPGDGLVDQKPVIRLANVSKPSITIYYPVKAKKTGAAMIVCPGGGYSILAMDLEGTEICYWLTSIGVTAVLLKYRVPARKELKRYTAALQDAQRAMGLVRYNAGKWGIDPSRIGIMGFSAGGHLSAALSTNFTQRTYELFDAADKVSCRPDFVMLVYPAYLTIKEEGDKIAPELQVTNNTPPTLLIQTEDDPVRVESSLFYYLALKNANVPAEMHLYAKGGHGYGLRKPPEGLADWPSLAAKWLHTIGILNGQ